MAFIRYVQESYNELRNHVTWPTWPELQQTSIVVIVASVLLATMIWLMDKIWIFVLGFLY